MTVLEIVAAILGAGLLLISCSHVTYVPVCSEHGGVKTLTVSDHTDQWATRDAVCRDGVAQRPVQFDDGNGKWHLAVPSDR